MSEEFGKMKKATQGGHDRQVELLIWLRTTEKRDQQMINCCKLEQVGTKEH